MKLILKAQLHIARKESEKESSVFVNMFHIVKFLREAYKLFIIQITFKFNRREKRRSLQLYDHDEISLILL